MLCFFADGAPLSELSWSSSLAVVAVSFSGIFTVIVLMLACLCCKKGGIGFKVRTSQGCRVHPPPCSPPSWGYCDG